MKSFALRLVLKVRVSETWKRDSREAVIRPGPAAKRPHAPSLRTRDKSCALKYKNTSP